MHKLSKLLEIENKLKDAKFNKIKWLDEEILPLIESVNQLDLVDSSTINNKFKNLIEKITEINGIVESLEKLHGEYLHELLEQKKKTHQVLLKQTSDPNNYRLVWNNDKEYMSHRKLWVTTNSMYDEIKSTIGQYVTWKYPVVYYEPNTADITNIIVAGDPFYVIDDSEEIVKSFVEKFPAESHSKIHHYTKQQIMPLIEPSCANLVVNWKNFAFKKPIEIRRDLKNMSYLTRPGGYVMFDYANGETFDGARSIDDGLCTYMWKTKIVEWLKENDLELLHEIVFLNNPLSVIIAKKNGESKDFNIVNKLGLVLANKEVFDVKRNEETELRRYYKSINSQLEKDLHQLKERDVLLNELEKKRRVNTKLITEQKLKTAMNNLDLASRKFPNDHPVMLEAILNVSKLTYNLGRHKDSYNLIKRAIKDVERLDPENKIRIGYYEWILFLEGKV